MLYIYLIWAGGLIRAVVITEVLVGFCRFSLPVYSGMRLVHRCDVVAQGDGFHGLVDPAANALTNLWA